MKINTVAKGLLPGLLLAAPVLAAGAGGPSKMWSRTLQAEKCRLDKTQVRIVKYKGFKQNRGVALKSSARDRSQLGGGEKMADLTFSVNIPKDGYYRIRTTAAVDAYGTKLMKKAVTKYESLFIKLQIPGCRTTRRVAYEPWRLPNILNNDLGIFKIPGGKHTIRIDLPRGLVLDQITIHDYVPPDIPEGAENYKLPFKVPRRHPRVLMNPEELSRIRTQILHPDNSEAWNQLRKTAVAPYKLDLDLSQEVGYDKELLYAIRHKAFYALVAGSETVGREAVELTKKYLRCVEYGNLLDISRENGETIFTASIVYDWCYNLLSAEDKELFHKELMRLALIMECGLPPFKRAITTGHGNEAMMNRDLLSMAIALYDKEPKLLGYLAYQVFERLVPLRNFEYSGVRHSQGLSYAAYRFRWEMYNAFIFKRMLGREIFDKNFRNMGFYWLFMRTPGGVYFRDGDGIRWNYKHLSGALMLMCSHYAENETLKAAFRISDVSQLDPFEYLLFNNTELYGDRSKLALPQGFDFGTVYSAMITRTSWQIGDDSQAAAAEVRGGGFNSGGHQHCDAGNFQIYYRGQIICPLDQYLFAGGPYYFNFATRSVARSMMLVYDPKETFMDGRFHNDGGTRFIDLACGSLPMLQKGELIDKSIAHLLPKDTLKRLKAGDFYYYGSKLSTSFVPDADKPVFSIFSTNLKGAYAEKVKDLVRTFAFIDLGIKDQPALAVVYDQLVKRSADLDAYWQVTTLIKPRRRGNDVLLTSYRADDKPRGKMLLKMVKPTPDERKLEILTGKAAHNVFGKQFSPPRWDTIPSKGTRVMFKNLKRSARQEFFCIMNMYAEESKPCPAKAKEFKECFVVTAADRALVLVKGIEPRAAALSFVLPSGKTLQTAVHNLRPGKWQLKIDGKDICKVNVEPGQLTAAWSCQGGKVTLTPEK